MKRFPKTIHVTRAQVGTEDEFLSVEDDTKGTNIDQTTDVAIYELVEVGKVVVTRHLERRYRPGKKKRRRT